MTTTEERSGIRHVPSVVPLVRWTVGLCVLAVVTLFVGVGVAAILARSSEAADWGKLSDVGQTFGALSSIISGLALVALVVTARTQFREMQQSRRELEHQRQSLTDNHMELQRTASANLGMLHLEILKLSIDDPSLAEVWPSFDGEISPELNRQYLYANVIYQFQFRAMLGGQYTDEQMVANLRYLFTSSLMRGYWKASRSGRDALPEGSAELAFVQKVDEVCREFDTVAASAHKRTSRSRRQPEQRERPERAA